MSEVKHTPEMVERVARALAISDNKDPDAPAWVQYPGCVPSGVCWRDQYSAQAIAALDASAHHELQEALERIKSGDITPPATSMLLDGDWQRAYGDLQDIATKALAKSRGQS